MKNNLNFGQAIDALKQGKKEGSKRRVERKGIVCI